VLDCIPAGAGGSVVRYAVRGTPVVVRLPLGGAHNARNGAAGAGLAGLAAVGAQAPLVIDEARAAGLSAARAVAAASPEEAAATLAPWTAPGDWILVKASRGLRLERAVETLRAALGPSTERGT
jgi:UDP-N-acetylmuramyl pentapeptide synthase